MGKLTQGQTITLQGKTYTVLVVCRGEGQARTVARREKGLEYRAIEGQWVALKPINQMSGVPDYFYR